MNPPPLVSPPLVGVSLWEVGMTEYALFRLPELGPGVRHFDSVLPSLIRQSIVGQGEAARG
jgi:hypothetical protein